MPQKINDVLSEVSDVFDFAKLETENCDYTNREMYDGEKSNIFQYSNSKLNNKDIFITHGTQVFPDKTVNEYVETYLGKDDEGEQTGGWGVIKYPDGSVEIHYDKFENGKALSGFGLVIDDDIVVYYEADYSAEFENVKEHIYTADGEELKDE